MRTGAWRPASLDPVSGMSVYVLAGGGVAGGASAAAFSFARSCACARFTLFSSSSEPSWSLLRAASIARAASVLSACPAAPISRFIYRDDEDAYRFVFDSIDFAAYEKRTLPMEHRARLTAFAHVLKAFESAAAYDALHTEETLFRSKCFITTGLIAAALDKEANRTPATQAMLTGEVMEHQLLTNEVTGQQFHWMLVVGPDAAAFDVVADPEIVTGEIKVGGTVEIGCLMFGRFLET